MARRTISFYATVKTYMPLWELHGFADNAVAAGDAFRRGDLAAVPAAISDEMVETYCAAGPLDKVRARVEATAERADGLFLTPPTYFISPEELSEYQNRLIDAFGPADRCADSRSCEVLERVRAIPEGFVSTYGDVSPGAPRFAGAVLFEATSPTCPGGGWSAPTARSPRALGRNAHLIAEGVPFRGERVDIERPLRAELLVARGDAEDRDDLGVVGLGVDDVGAGAAAEPAGGFVVADEDAGVVLAVAVLDPDLVALLEAVLDLVCHRAQA